MVASLSKAGNHLKLCNAETSPPGRGELSEQNALRNRGG